MNQGVRFSGIWGLGIVHMSAFFANAATVLIRSAGPGNATALASNGGARINGTMVLIEK